MICLWPLTSLHMQILMKMSNLIGVETTVEMIQIPRYYSVFEQLTMYTHKPDEGKTQFETTLTL